MSGIAVENLEKTYPGTAEPAVGGVTLTVEPGEVFGLLGPNGAGKSTIIGACTTRVIPSAGHVRIGTIDIAADPVGAKRRIGVMPQYSTLDRSVSVWENLYLHCRYFGMAAPAARARSDELLDLFSLAGHRKDLGGPDMEALSELDPVIRWQLMRDCSVSGSLSGGRSAKRGGDGPVRWSRLGPRSPALTSRRADVERRAAPCGQLTGGRAAVPPPKHDQQGRDRHVANR